MFKVKLHDVRTLKWWFSRRDEIDFEPPYQRKGGLWSVSDKAYLIDSILNEYDIPKIYLADFTILNSVLNNYRRPYAIIDGRQRLESIFGFFNNEFPLNERFEFFENSTLRLGGLFFSDLSRNYPKVASIFEEFNLHVMSVITDDEAKINDLFVRLNTSKALTGAELRNAMTGKVPDSIRIIVNHDFFKTKIKFSTKRGQDKNAAAKLLLLEFRGKIVDTKKYNINRFVEEGTKSETDNIERAASRVCQILDDMSKVFNRADPLLASEGIVTLYYWLIRTMGYHHKMREFLVNFFSYLKKNRSLSKQDIYQADPEMLSFDIKSRSVNDQGSLQDRHTILLDKFNQFRNEGII